MKKLLATTAMCLVIATGFNGLASASEVTVTYDAQEFSEASIKQNVLVVETNFHRGDFQLITRSAVTNDLYSGIGSSLMSSVRMFRY